MRQKWGQHFLSDANVAKRMVEAAGLGPQEEVLEIGPGRGVLTRLIVPRVRRTVAVELDHGLARSMKERFKGLPITIVSQDVLETDLTALFPKNSSVKVLSNLPYHAAAPILQKLMHWKGWSQAWVMVQKEMALRIAARPGVKDYGILSLAIQLWCDVEAVMEVGPGSFKPPPKVDSTVLRLTRLAQPRVPLPDEEAFFRIVRAAFGQRRKTLLNALSHGLDRPKPEVSQALAQAGIDETLRGETLSLEDYSRLNQVCSGW